jgi:hypothetical protein
MLSTFVALTAGLAAFVPPASTLAPARAVVSPSADVSMMAEGYRPSRKKNARSGAPEPVKAGGRGVTGYGQRVTGKEKPLSPGSNYPGTKNIQIQSTGFGSFVQKFQMKDGKSKYGMPIFLPSGNINPAYLAAERQAMQSQSKKNIQALSGKTKKMKAAKTFLLGDYIAKSFGPATDRDAYFASGGVAIDKYSNADKRRLADKARKTKRN